jgi:hypothetical protein
MDELLQMLAGGTGKPQGGQDDAPLDTQSVLASLLGGARDEQAAAGGAPLAGLLAALLGGGSGGGGNDLSGLAEEAQVTPAIVQAVVALLIGQMGKPGATKAGGADLAALLDQASSGAEVDEAALKSSGLPLELAKTTGLDLAAALRVLQKLLPSLAGLLNLPGLKPAAKPKPKPKPAAKPRPSTAATAKPKPAAATATKPKPKPKPAAATTTKPKPKPKPAAATTTKPKPTSSGKPKPAAKPRPRKSDGSVEINLDAPLAPDS